jgi:hypothetical protein
MCILCSWITYTIHATWKLLSLVLRDRIIASANAPWAYVWWAYIDGGDMLYPSTDADLTTMEALSVINRLLGFTGVGERWGICTPETPRRLPSFEAHQLGEPHPVACGG